MGVHMLFEMKIPVLHLLVWLITLSSNRLVDGNPEPPKKVNTVFLLTDQRKYIPIPVHQSLRIMLVPDDMYIPVDKFYQKHHIFYADKHYSKQNLGLRLHWIFFHSESCSRKSDILHAEVTYSANQTNLIVPNVISTFDHLCRDINKPRVVTVEPGNVNISYSGRPHGDKLILLLTPYEVITGVKCKAGFEACPENNKVICISKHLVCGRSDAGCKIVGGQCDQTEEPSTSGYSLPLGFIGAISGLVITGILFLIGLIIWYRWKKARERGTSSTTSVAQLTPHHVHAVPNDYTLVPPPRHKNDDDYVVI